MGTGHALNDRVIRVAPPLTTSPARIGLSRAYVTSGASRVIFAPPHENKRERAREQYRRDPSRTSVSVSGRRYRQTGMSGDRRRISDRSRDDGTCIGIFEADTIYDDASEHGVIRLGTLNGDTLGLTEPPRAMSAMNAISPDRTIALLREGERDVPRGENDRFN